ncbi:hypothetical protein CROQUDRAFT_49918 [Cronartium quercuum f. sp. fusiforme G11]|uniref:Secreted protein n=1 Tax=Cronartium quercuum f. sp. fusiforme G11 TaxID=708437 RepID=A0A9P6NBT9_9BASI|nr:hypothetical protein CROQUDRAFT_49918 [Cronartium quercuum f. sp. fusiforme G11]
MQFAANIILIALAAFPAVLATIHTECYNYFLKKDGCVWSAADTRNRCNATTGKPPNKPVGLFAPKSPAPPNHSSKRSLERRYTSSNTNTSFIIDSGDGICGNYTTNQPGACLWVGSDAINGSDPNTAGWLNGAKTSNCGKQLYVQRSGNKSSVVYVPVLDGCRFYSRNASVGCFQIALSNKTFYDLNPTPQEIARGYLGDLIWDFNDEFGLKTTWGPV